MYCKDCKFWDSYGGTIYKHTHIRDGNSHYGFYDREGQEHIWKTEKVKDVTGLFGGCENPKLASDEKDILIEEGPNSDPTPETQHYYSSKFNDELVVQSRDGEHAFITGQFFGCVHFEPKPSL